MRSADGHVHRRATSAQRQRNAKAEATQKLLFQTPIPSILGTTPIPQAILSAESETPSALTVGKKPHSGARGGVYILPSANVAHRGECAKVGSISEHNLAKLTIMSRTRLTRLTRLMRRVAATPYLGTSTAELEPDAPQRFLHLRLGLRGFRVYP